MAIDDGSAIQFYLSNNIDDWLVPQFGNVVSSAINEYIFQIATASFQQWATLQIIQMFYRSDFIPAINRGAPVTVEPPNYRWGRAFHPPGTDQEFIGGPAARRQMIKTRSGDTLSLWDLYMCQSLHICWNTSLYMSSGQNLS